MELKNKGVLVTGGASGLGAACVCLLAQEGASVVIADLNSEGGEQLLGEALVLLTPMLPTKARFRRR